MPEVLPGQAEGLISVHSPLPGASPTAGESLLRVTQRASPQRAERVGLEPGGGCMCRVTAAGLGSLLSICYSEPAPGNRELGLLFSWTHTGIVPLSISSALPRPLRLTFEPNPLADTCWGR